MATRVRLRPLTGGEQRVLRPHRGYAGGEADADAGTGDMRPTGWDKGCATLLRFYSPQWIWRRASCAFSRTQESLSSSAASRASIAAL